MSKPTREEMLEWLDDVLMITQPDEDKKKILRSLISRYGDGGPKVTYRMLENAVIEIRLSRPEVPNMELVLKLKDALERRGVEVGEEKHD